LIWHMASAFDFSLRLVQFTSIVATQGMAVKYPLPPMFLCKVLERFDLRVDLEFSQVLNLLRSVGGTSRYACSDDVVCQVSPASILAELVKR
jgi:hypothetical protein